MQKKKILYFILQIYRILWILNIQIVAWGDLTTWMNVFLLQSGYRIIS